MLLKSLSTVFVPSFYFIVYFDWPTNFIHYLIDFVFTNSFNTTTQTCDVFGPFLPSKTVSSRAVANTMSKRVSGRRSELVSLFLHEPTDGHVASNKLFQVHARVNLQPHDGGVMR